MAPDLVTAESQADARVSGRRAHLSRPGVQLSIWWLATRGTLLGIWLVALIGFDVPSARGDVAYYFRAIAALAERGPAMTLIEYPTPVVALTWLLYALSGAHENGFLGIFVTLMVGVDAAFTWFLWRVAGVGRTSAVAFWIAFVFLLGPTVFLRFDLLPAALTGTALVLATGTRPRNGIAGALVAAATALKLWPMATWPSTWGTDRASRWRSAVGLLSVGGVLAIGSVVWAGWARLISPLTWQSGRGLQIESVFATPTMIARALDPGAYTVGMSRYQAFEIAGPGTSDWLSLADVAAVIGYVVIVALSVVLWRRPARGPSAPVIVMVLAAVILVVANKTFSPQYMLWIGGPLAAGLVRLDVDGGSDQRTIRRIAVLVLGLAMATALIYPIGYRPLIYGLPGVGAVTAVLALRNLGMLVLLGLLVRWAWHGVVRRRSE